MLKFSPRYILSMIVLSWLIGNPRRFKTYVGNRVSSIMDWIPPDRWSHVGITENPADCASRGLLPSELVHNELWWKGPPWLVLTPSCWPKQPRVSVEQQTEEMRVICLVTIVRLEQPNFRWGCYSSFTHLQRVTACVLRFINNCRPAKGAILKFSTAAGYPSLAVAELFAAERYLVKISQQCHFSSEIASLEAEILLSPNSCLRTVHPLLTLRACSG